ncbi:hypothetical protein ACVDG5_018110 [Mesorhizobium sp. ORM6]
MKHREVPGSFDDVIRLVMIEINKAVADGTSIESAVRTALFPVLVGPVPEGTKDIGNRQVIRTGTTDDGEPVYTSTVSSDPWHQGTNYRPKDYK